MTKRDIFWLIIMGLSILLIIIGKLNPCTPRYSGITNGTQQYNGVLPESPTHLRPYINFDVKENPNVIYSN